MSGGEDDPLGLEEKLDPWMNRIYGMATVCGAIGGFITGGALLPKWADGIHCMDPA